MGGHGGLNILPQKRWNVYNFDNRERVRKDEEAAAREENIRQQQQREKDAEARLEKLRETALAKRGSTCAGSNDFHGTSVKAESECGEVPQQQKNGEGIQHINLFEGWVGFQRVPPGVVGSAEFKGDVDKQVFRGDKELERLYKRATKEATKVRKDGVEADDEHYKLGYGCSGTYKKRPWYLTKSSLTDESQNGPADAHRSEASVIRVEKRKKTIDELREERLKREQQEREKARRLLGPPSNARLHNLGAIGTDGRRRPYYNSSFGNAR